MDLVSLDRKDSVAILTLTRGKVNAIVGNLINELRKNLEALEEDCDIRSIIITGKGKFFSFGFDIPELLHFTKPQFVSFITSFTDLYRYLFLYPKPVVAALNGHTIAGGCMLALACDLRVMATGKARISLNEITLGASVFVGSTEMLRFWTGSAEATKILFSGGMYSAEEAMNLGIVQEATAEENLMAAARKTALEMGSKDPKAFKSIKSLLRTPVLEEMNRREEESIKEFSDLWYSESTWAKLKGVKIF
jgi:Delta3-Delta2-enoyl-CoA isomerase